MLQHALKVGELAPMTLLGSRAATDCPESRTPKHDGPERLRPRWTKGSAGTTRPTHGLARNSNPAPQGPEDQVMPHALRRARAQHVHNAARPVVRHRGPRRASRRPPDRPR